MILIIFNSTRS